MNGVGLRLRVRRAVGAPVTTNIIHGTSGPGNSYLGGDLGAFVNSDGTVFLGAQPGRLPLGGTTDTGGGCRTMCNPSFDLWLEGGAVTHVVANLSCVGIC